jgi:hypothetical protein
MNEPHWLGGGDGGEVEARIGLRKMKLFPSYETALAECVRWNRWHGRRWPDSDGHFGIEKYVKATEETA